MQLRAGLLLYATTDAEPLVTPAGSCAAYRSPQTFLTAAHCLREDRSSHIYVPGHDPTPVTRSEVHETADLAVLHAPQAGIYGEPFTGIAESLVEGGDYTGFGFPVEGAPTDAPVGRVLRGYFQRYMPYTSNDGRRYFAAEMSAPAPGGSSGSVLVLSNAPDRAAAVVARNHDSWMTVERIEELESGGRVNRVEVRKVITYGIAVVLHSHREWIDEMVDSMLAAC